MKRAAVAAEILEAAAWHVDIEYFVLVEVAEIEAASFAAYAAVEACAYRMSPMRAAGIQLQTARTCWLLALGAMPIKEARSTVIPGLM